MSGLPSGALVSGDKERAARRRVIGEPAAGVIGGGPGGRARVIDGEFVAGIEGLAHEAAHAVAAGLHELRGDVVDAVRGGVLIAQKIVGAIPRDDVFARGEEGFGDQIADAEAIRLFNDERDVAGLLQREMDRNRRRRGSGFFRREESPISDRRFRGLAAP